MQRFIENYIQKISKKDILSFAYQNNLSLSKEEIDILYHYLLNNYKELLSGNSRGIFEALEDKIDSDKLDKIKELYEFYYNKYQDLL